MDPWSISGMASSMCKLTDVIKGFHCLFSWGQKHTGPGELIWIKRRLDVQICFPMFEDGMRFPPHIHPKVMLLATYVVRKNVILIKRQNGN